MEWPWWRRPVLASAAMRTSSHGATVGGALIGVRRLKEEYVVNASLTEITAIGETGFKGGWT